MHWSLPCTIVLTVQVVLTERPDVFGSGEVGRVLYQGRAPSLVRLSSILISKIFEGGCCTLGLPDYFPLYVVMLWLCSVAKNILPGFFFTFEASTGLISHLCRLRTSCQRADSARSLSPSNFALAPFLPWKLRLCLHAPSLDSAATHHFCGYLTWDGTDGASKRLMCVTGLFHRFLLRILGRLPAVNTHSSTH